MAITITAPSKIDGVQNYGPYPIAFVEGVAEVKELAPGVAQYMLDAGYKIEAEPVDGPAQAEGNPIAKMKKSELEAFAAERGIDLGSASKVAEMRAVIIDAVKQDDAEDQDDPDTDDSDTAE